MVSPSAIVALESIIEGAELPMISDETNSLLISYLICSTKPPFNAASLSKLFTLSLVVSLFN
jgi:hypothetical protein